MRVVNHIEIKKRAAYKMPPDGVYWANALFNNVVAQFIGPGLINQATTKIYGG